MVYCDAYSLCRTRLSGICIVLDISGIWLLRQCSLEQWYSNTLVINRSSEAVRQSVDTAAQV